MGGYLPRSFESGLFFLETLIPMFWSMDALPVGHGREPWVDHHPWIVFPDWVTIICR